MTRAHASFWIVCIATLAACSSADRAPPPANGVAGIGGNAPGSGAPGGSGSGSHGGSSGSSSSSKDAGTGSGGTVAIDAGWDAPGEKGKLDPDVQAFAEALQLDLEDASKTTPSQLQDQYALPLTKGVSYDASKAQSLDAIQASSMNLESQELDVLAKQGFVISGRQSFPTYTYGYAAIYVSDLPVFISADSIADALHRSYDDILQRFEAGLLRNQLDQLLSSLRAKLAKQPESQTRSDLDTYLTVAHTLLAPTLIDGTPTLVTAQAGGDQKTIDDLVDKAVSANGEAIIELFGGQRVEDMSQFKPRGHYEGDSQLEAYFRAMMWLGRIDLRMVETDDNGLQHLNRKQVEATLLLHSLFDATDTQRFHRVDDVVRAFVGESDNMTLDQLPALLKALGISDAAGLAKISDRDLMDTILVSGFGKQQIMSHLLVGGIAAPVPLNASFLLFGQRYIVDSHVLANVTWDRVRAMRMMPDPLDVAFAALGNDQAASLLKDQLEKYDYAGNLAAVRTLVEANDDAFWHANLYNDWLSALRALSPIKDVVKDPSAMGIASVAASEAWGRRILNTQLASWAQLRHDTLLYAKQSYSGVGATCAFPDAAIDPYPEFYAAVGRFADHGYALAKLTDGTDVEWLGDSMRDYFMQMRDVADMLKSLAESERSGAELTADQLAFINDAVVTKTESAGCTSVETAAGWYTRLFFDQSDIFDYDPTIADVHTQPTDEDGNPVGRILHVATDSPRLMVVTQDGCGTPKAYVSLASAYYEKITDSFQRVTDSEWTDELNKDGPPDEVPWMQDLVPLTR